MVCATEQGSDEMTDRPSTPDKRLLTIGEVAELLGVSVHRARYVVDSRRIKPTQRAGILRLWHVDDIPTIERALRGIESSNG